MIKNEPLIKDINFEFLYVTNKYLLKLANILKEFIIRKIQQWVLESIFQIFFPVNEQPNWEEENILLFYD